MAISADIFRPLPRIFPLAAACVLITAAGASGILPLEPLSLPPHAAGIIYSPWALLTYQLVHFDSIHLIFNLICIALAVIALPRDLSTLRFYALFLLCGIAGGIVWLAASPADAGPLCGASASALGLCASAALAGSRKPLRRLLLLPVAAGVIAVSPALAAHLGGIAAGIAAGLMLRRSSRRRHALSDKQMHRDALINKMSISGYGSLSEQERESLIDNLNSDTEK